MEKLIFSCASSGSDPEILIMAGSIREFAGAFSDFPIYVLVPKPENRITEEMKEQLSSLNVQVIPFSVDPDSMKFPFASWVYAAATIEVLTKKKTEYLAWIGTNTMVIREPKHFLLDKGKNLGYRPVHHTLIGSIYEKPVDPFWEFIYQKCNVTEDKIFPMKTHVDHNILRPYFNSGCLIVRPEKGLLQSWWDCFKDVYHDPYLEEYYRKDELYSIFIHQAVLSGVILSTMKRQELQELPFNYNYPLHLYDECPVEYRPQNISDLVTARFYLNKLLEPQGLEKIPFHDPLKCWLEAKLNFIEKVLIPAER